VGAKLRNFLFATWLAGLPATCLQGDWTVECWVRPSSLAAASSVAVFGALDASGSVLLRTMLHSNSTASVFALDASGLTARVVSAASASTIGVGVWVHVAVVEYK
jgi:hypothetical protein